MLKRTMIRIAKVAVLASLIVSTVVMGGCESDPKDYNGHWFAGFCMSGGTQCRAGDTAWSNFSH